MIYGINEITTDEYYDKKLKAKKDEKSSRLEKEKKYSSYTRDPGDRYQLVAQNGDFDYSKKFNNQFINRRLESDPRHDNARRIKDIRNKYDEVMPKSKSKSEADYDAHKKDIEDEYEHANNVVYNRYKMKNDYDTNDVNMQMAASAARRKYRKDLKKKPVREFGIFESVIFI